MGTPFNHRYNDEDRKKMHSPEALEKKKRTLQAKKDLRENVNAILAEDDERNNALQSTFDPITGYNSVGDRVPFFLRVKQGVEYKWWIPRELAGNELVRELNKCGSIRLFCKQNCMQGKDEMVLSELIKLRAKYDFPFYAASFVSIKSKKGGSNVKFVLNYPQRILCGVFERLRTQGKPIKVIVLKARQWGGSTLTQNYMAWIQLMHKEGWYSAIVAHQSSAALKIKAMYDKMIRDFPPSLLGIPDKGKMALTP